MTWSDGAAPTATFGHPTRGVGGTLRRRQLLGVIAALAAAGCGGGGEDERASPALSAPGGALPPTPDRFVAAAETSSMGGGTGFLFAGVMQVLRVGIDEVFVPFGRYAKVWIAPTTTGQAIVAAPGAPALFSVDDELVVPAQTARVLVAAGAHGFTLRSAGPTTCSVQLFLGT